ncbi:hypothetical protein GCM10008995_10900 [Halobellus salinus]|uniref:PAS domain S-box protein n=1 Tax=Halobellus salinus TaxID=931585 RepID=A0A830E9J7_9EURY|nr:PAS domain S-box protein [Halobellus salinus]GGJ02934.1 hypothetical protein GCM10008995_10900 [Halobellus salinus]SMP22063.1 PAS domain S-box-containing protein [Halobellus salinus]
MNRGDLVGPVVVHSAGTITYANREFCELVGVDAPATVVGTPLGQFVADADRDRLADHFDRLGRNEKPAYGLAVELKPDGGVRTHVVTVSSHVEWAGETRIHTSVMDLGDTSGRLATTPRETAAHRSPIGVTIADATADDEPLVYVNDTFVELTGYTREEAIGRNCRFLQGPDTREEPVAEMRAAIDAERSVTVTLRNYRTDGSMFWNRVTISPVRDAAGTVTHLLGFQEDVSETKLNEHERALFQTHTEMSDQVMFVTDVNGVIEYVNPAFERVTGYTAAEAVGKTPRILQSGRQDKAFYEEMWETITAGEVWEAELTNRTKSGELYRSKQKIVPVTDDLGAVTHFVALEPDVTDERLRTQALDVLNRILRHNVRTSVNVIEGYTELLESGVEGAERRSAIRTIRERTAALQEISDQTTRLRELIQAETDPSPLPVGDIAGLVDDLQEAYPDATLSATIESGGDRTIQNGSMFAFALEELVENAVVHADRDPARADVTVTDSVVDNTVTVEVADNGPGIPESEWEVIKTGTETPLQHTNSIGLWVIYWSVTTFGGSIDLSANQPRGSVFTVQVPVETAPAERSESRGPAE